MKLKYRTYEWPVNGVRVTSSRKVERGKDALPWRYIDTLNCDGYLEGSSQADLTDKQRAMTVALMRPGGKLTLLRDDGADSATLLDNASSITGVVVTDGPNFPDADGPEYVTQRHFVFTAEADYYARGTNALTLLDWQETISITGGGPLYVVRPALYGPPQRQKVYEQTPCQVVQSGYAVGLVRYPTPPPQLFPFALKMTPEVRETTPTKRGNGYTEYRIDWTYTFEWPLPLFAHPTPWPI